jgi:hypothetical protein
VPPEFSSALTALGRARWNSCVVALGGGDCAATAGCT